MNAPLLALARPMVGTQRSETWDGRIRGHAPVLGAYVWRFQQDDEAGRPFTAAGTVTIVQ